MSSCPRKGELIKKRVGTVGKNAQEFKSRSDTYIAQQRMNIETASAVSHASYVSETPPPQVRTPIN